MPAVIRIHPERQLLRIDARSLLQLNQQRHANGQKPLHRCTVCGQAGEWGPGWLSYGSQRDADDDTLAKFCGPECRDKMTPETALQIARRDQ